MVSSRHHGDGSVAIALACLLVLVASKPVPPPDMTSCQRAFVKPDHKTEVDCCMPVSTGPVVDFTLPPSTQPMRVRRPAHMAGDNQTYLQKYTHAVNLMRKLDKDHPWHFMQQAKIHCAYCNGAYKQSGYEANFQVHGSWLFFPFHRAYLYFYEKILGKLLDDDTFALPYWNWDHPDGMLMPEMYAKKDKCGRYGHMNCALYDSLRDAKHLPPAVADFDFSGDDTAEPDASTYDAVKTKNLRVMYRQMVRNGATANLFLGSPYRAGDQPSPGGGSVESVPHGTMHDWTGDSDQTYREHMGTFYSAGRDPIFYSHHANVDRMWEIWRTLPGRNRQDFVDTDWLDSSFIFWDENKQMVRIRVRDVLDTTKLGYTYEKMDTPWLDYKPVVSNPPPRPRVGFGGWRPVFFAVTPPTKYPIVLDKDVRVDLKRPKQDRTSEEKEEAEEVVVIEEIKVRAGDYIKFDVFINGDKSMTSESANFAGSFVSVPMLQGSDDGAEEEEDSDAHPDGINSAGATTTSLTLALNGLLDDINANHEETISVVLVPRLQAAGTGRQGSVTPATIGGLKITYQS